MIGKNEKSHDAGWELLDWEGKRGKVVLGRGEGVKLKAWV